MIDYKVLIFYRLKNMTDLVFHETIPICCGNRVNAKKYAEKDFWDMLEDLCPDLEPIILDLRIKSEMTNQSVLEYENYLAEIETQKDKENLEILLKMLGPATSMRGKTVRGIFEKYGIDRCTKLFDIDTQKLLKELRQQDGVGDGTIKIIRDTIEKQQLEYYEKANSYFSGSSYRGDKNIIKTIY